MAKKGFLDGYKTYNPEKEGYGNPKQWNKAFHKRMGIEEAKKTLGDTDPLSILGLSGKPSWDTIKSQYRKLVLQHHPDRGGDPEMFKQIQAAYELLEETNAGSN